MSLRDALRHQALSCDALGSPFMRQLLDLLADRLEPGTPVADRLFNWQGDLRPSGHSVPLRLAGGLHALVLTHPKSDLAGVYPPNSSTDDALWAAVSAALEQYNDFFQNWLDSPPQTNEVRRSAALIPAANWLAARFDLPLVLSELGASAGLNLMVRPVCFDHAAWRQRTCCPRIDPAPRMDRPCAGKRLNKCY